MVRLRSWLVLCSLLAAGYNAGTMWMTQVNWSLWPYVGPAEFPRFHRGWWRAIRPVVFPVGLGATLASVGQVRWRPAGVAPWLAWSGVGLWVLTWGSTALWWGRFQARLDDVRLEGGALNPLYTRLVRTHWWRVAMMSALAVVQLAIAAGHFGRRELVAGPIAPRTGGRR
jgi:hypothetical protein